MTKDAYTFRYRVRNCSNYSCVLIARGERTFLAPWPTMKVLLQLAVQTLPSILNTREKLLLENFVLGQGLTILSPASDCDQIVTKYFTPDRIIVLIVIKGIGTTP